MSVRSEKAAPMGASDQMAQAITEAQPTDAALQEGAAYSTATPENPLQRNIVVSVRASLNELCLQKQKGTWAPSAEALRSMFQQKVRYTHTRTTRRPPPTSPQPLTRLAPVRPVRRSTRASTAPPTPRATSRYAHAPANARSFRPSPHRPGLAALTRFCAPLLAVDRAPLDGRAARQVDLPLQSRSADHRRRRQDLLVHGRGLLHRR